MRRHSMSPVMYWVLLAAVFELAGNPVLEHSFPMTSLLPHSWGWCMEQEWVLLTTWLSLLLGILLTLMICIPLCRKSFATLCRVCFNFGLASILWVTVARREVHKQEGHSQGVLIHGIEPPYWQHQNAEYRFLSTRTIPLDWFFMEVQLWD